MSVVLDVQPDTDYEPSEAEMIEYGKWLGMEMPEDMPLLWIAREGLKAPLPDNWKACKSEKGELYYFNFKTGQSIWDHPSDEHYRELLSSEKAKLKAKDKGKEQSDNTPAAVSPTNKGGKTSKKKKAKSSDSGTAEANANLSEEKKATPTVQQVQSALLAPTIQPKRELPAPVKLASLGTDALKASEKANTGRAGSSEFQLTTSQSDSSSASEFQKTQKVDEPEAIPLPSKVVAGGGVNGLRALDKLGGSSPTAVSNAAMKAAAVSFAKEQKIKADQQAAKELETYKTEQQKALQAKADQQLVKEVDAYKAERYSVLRAKVDEDLAAELENYKAEQRKAFLRRKEEFDNGVAEELKRCEEQAEAEKEKRRKANEMEIAAAMEEGADELKKELEKKLGELRQEFEARRAAESERLREKLKAQLDHDKRKAEAEVAQMLETFTREKRQESEIKKEAQSQALQEANKDISDVRQCSASFLRQYEEALSKFEKAVQNSKTVFDQVSFQKQKNLQVELETKLAEMTRDHEVQVEREKERFKEQLESLKKDYALETDSLGQHHQQELQRLRNNFDEQRSQIQKEQVSQEHDRFMEMLAGIKEAQAKELSELKRQLKEKAQEELNEIMQELAKEKQARNSSISALRDSVSHEPSPRVPQSTSQSATDDDERTDKHKLSPPRLDQKLLARSSQDDAAPSTPAAQSQQDMKTLITEALREVFAGSPFILPSPGQGEGSRTAPATPAASSSPTVTKNISEFRASTALAPQTPSFSGHWNRPVGVLSLPLSFQEQRNLVEGERRRVQEGRKYVELQQQNLDERRQQLKRTRHQWKQDVLAAKAEGVRSSSKRGQLLNKVRLSLEEQAKGLEHDMLILRDSQLWLLSKEQRLMVLERQIEEQERLKSRSGGDASTLNNMSVDTAALMTGYFRPQRYSSTSLEAPVYCDATRRESLGSGPLPVGNYATSPVLSKALSRIEKRLDEVTSIINLQQQQHVFPQVTETPHNHSSCRHITVSPMLRDAAQRRAHRHSHNQPKPEILRRESHLDQWQGPSM